MALVLDGEGKLVESSSRARELFPALELGKVVPEAVELANARRIRYEQGTERRTLIVAPLVDQTAYEELRVGFTAAGETTMFTCPAAPPVSTVLSEFL